MQQIRVCGSGGQGIVIAGRLLAEAAIKDRKSVSLSVGYGSAVRGGISQSDVVFSDSFIDFPMIIQIDLLICMFEEAYIASLSKVKENGIIVLDDTLVKPRVNSQAKHWSIPATETAIKILKNQMAANIILLAAANYITQLVSVTSLENSIRSTVSSKFVEPNLQAMHLGVDLAQKLMS